MPTTTSRSRSTFSAGRRGVAGTLVVEKIVGAAAEAGRIGLPQEPRRPRKRAHALDGRRPDELHGAGGGAPDVSLGETEMEMGVGIHGEPGRRRVPLAPCRRVAEEMVGAIAGRSRRRHSGEALLLVNGFGGTPLMELYLMDNAARPKSKAGRAGRPVAGRLSSPRSTWPAAR